MSDGRGAVHHIDPSTGSVLASFNTFDPELSVFGNYDGDLLGLSSGLAPTPVPKTIYVYSTSGSLVHSITLQTVPLNVSWFGLTSDGTNLYLGDYTSGNIFEYSTAGALLGSIQTNIGSGLTGVSYDPANNSFWVSNAVTDREYDLSTSGALLSEFANNSEGGIVVVPGAIAPEPASFLFMALASVIALAVRIAARRRTGFVTSNPDFPK